MKRLIIVLIFISNVFKVCAQDALFVNPQQSLVYLNPSFAGSNGGIRNQLSYRNQWPNLSGTLVTVNNSFDAFIKPLRGGLSVNLFHDDQARGTFQTQVFSIAYAQHISLMENQLKIIPSFQFGYFKHTLDRGRPNLYDVFNIRRGWTWIIPGSMPKSQVENYDLSSGLLINYKNTFLGASVFHINQPNEGLIGESKMPYLLNIHASHNYFATEKLLLNFFIQYTKQHTFESLNFQTSALLYKHFLLSAGLSNNYNTRIGSGYRHHLFCFTLNYDVTYSKLSGNTAGSWELNISYTLRNKENRKELACFENW